ncbi:MAG TPA: prolyl oligopeptidase family serine peptidase [Frateuria sp.]|uniref:alpha/beta hydrolase family protein n=1 Tax=Frateuria sp. TaxID=2211372 RepID=UPI002D7F315B|nr:prolyl oligopeptidase family serine peptidase [Frateuria sp.]HET6807124.1 prolyl oligopeptidase family serine peptidase [Frateuria sp.]
MNARRWIGAMGLLCVMALQARPVSLADLARHMQYDAVKISPDGSYVAATAVVKGHTVLALVRLADMKGQLVRPREGDAVTGFWWVSPSRVVYTVGMRVGGYDAPLPSGELYGVNADGTGAQMLFGARKRGMDTGSLVPRVTSTRGTAEFIAAIPGDPNHALVSVGLWDAGSEDERVATAYRMDVRTGALIKLLDAPMRGARFLADHRGRIRFAWGEDEHGEARVFQHPLDGSGWKAMPALRSGRSIPIAFDRDDSAAYFTCPGTPTGFGICRWTEAKPGLEQVWSNPDVEADGLLQGLAEGDIIGVAYMDGRAAIAPFDMHSPAAQALVALMKQFPGESVRFVSGTRDGRLSVVLVEADADPGTFYLFDARADTLTPLLRRASWIAPLSMATKQPFEFTARDGLKLQGYVSYPPGHEHDRHLPTVVVVHGGPFFVRDRWDYDADVQALATHGYAVVQVNFRGSGGYGYAFEQAGWREWGGRMQDDVTDATRWAIGKGIADPRRLCIYGASYGGYAALEGAVKEPGLYKCAIGYVGIYDLPRMYRDGDTHESTAGRNFLARQVGDDMAELARRSPVNQLDALQAHVMLVVGDKDERVPPIQGLSLHKALLERNVAHVWLEKPDEMHGFYDEDNITELYTRMMEFIEASIGPGGGSH